MPSENLDTRLQITRVLPGAAYITAMASEPKRRKIESETSRRATSIPSEKDTTSASKDKPTLHAAQTSGVNPKIQQARDLAVAQAQQESSKGNFRIFDSPFGNFLVPVIPTRAELGG